MNIYLIQHGEAEPENVNPERPLTQKGRNDVLKTAEFMEKAGIKVDEVWHSSKLRAKQTAEIIAKTLGLKDPIEKEGLKPNDPVSPISDQIEEENKNIIIASHLPFLSKLSALLVCGKENQQVIAFKQGGVVCLEKQESGWIVSWMIVPEVLCK